MKRNGAKRRLVFDEDEEEVVHEPVSQTFKALQERHEEECQRRWNFNFRLGQPLCGPIKWTARNPSTAEHCDDNPSIVEHGSDGNPSIVGRNSAENDENNYSTHTPGDFDGVRERKFARPAVRKTLIFVGKVSEEFVSRQKTDSSDCCRFPGLSDSCAPEVPNVEPTPWTPQFLKLSLSHWNSPTSISRRRAVKRNLEQSTTLTDYFRVSKKKRGGK